MFGSMNPCQYLVQSASGLIKKATGLTTTTGILCGTSSSAVIQLWDTPTTNADPKAVAVTPQLTLVAGTPYPVPAKFNYGIYTQLVSGSGSWAVYFD